MNVIGIRVSPKKIFYAIISTKSNAVLNVDNVKIPQSLSIPEQLSFIRTNFIDIFVEYNIKRAGIRVTESFAGGGAITRVQIESVLQEMLSSVPLDSYYIGQISSISSRIGIKKEDFKNYRDDKVDLKLFDGWKDHNCEEKEALLTALGALK
jgi:hypothetical protein